MNTLNASLLSLAILVVATLPTVRAAEPVTPVQRALARLYNFDFPGANRILDEHMAQHPRDPLGYTFRASSDLFFELDRLLILEGEFFSDDKRIAEKRAKVKPDPNIRAHFFATIEKARKVADSRLLDNQNDVDALFAQCILAGLVLDYHALVEKKQLMSLGYVKEAQRWALRLLKADPSYTDAHMTLGTSEYLLGSLPFFIKWFVKIDQAEGDKTVAVKKLEKVVEQGRYLGPFAKILLSIIHLREKRFAESAKLLAQLTREYPENPLYKKELSKIAKLHPAAAGAIAGTP